MHVLMRDEKEGRKKQARSNKQHGKATQHTQVRTSLHAHAYQVYTHIKYMYMHVHVYGIDAQDARNRHLQSFEEWAVTQQEWCHIYRGVVTIAGYMLDWLGHYE